MSNELVRRQFLKAGCGFIAGAAGTDLFGDFSAVLAQSTPQRDWRFCSKCQAMFFDGYPDKGSCPAGGGHNAMGYNFFLPHDIPGTSNTQDAWRYCGKCHSMFYDGYPDKGICAAGGGHNAMGYNFFLPHDIPGTSNTQDAWRYCGKCHVMFYDGYPDKGICAAGGGHNAMGYNFVLPFLKDYPEKVSRLLTNSISTDQIVDLVWNQVGKGIAAQQIKDQINGKEFKNGISGYNANVNLGGITEKKVTVGSKPSQVIVKIVISGNDTEFKTTTPCTKVPLLGCVGAGSYADPSFRLGFNFTTNLTISVQQSTNPIQVDALSVQVSNASIHGSNVAGTLIETLGDFFTGGDFSRKITSSVNQQIDLKNQLAGAIKSAIDNF